MEKNTLYILDNNDMQRKKLLELLAKEFDIVGELNDGQEGFEQICNLGPDLVIADIVLQNYDGFELLEKIASSASVKKPKVLILSSIKGEDFAQKAIDLGASYYLAKPVADDVLIKRIKSILQNDEQDSKKVYALKTTKNRALDEKISNIFITVGIPAILEVTSF